MGTCCAGNENEKGSEAIIDLLGNNQTNVTEQL